MNANQKWPILSSVAAHIFNLGDPNDFHQRDVLDLDRTEAQLSAWLQDVAPGVDGPTLKKKILVTHHNRNHEPSQPDGRQPWFDYVFVFDRKLVLVEEVMSYPHGEDISQPPARFHRFYRKHFSDCPESIQGLFPKPA